MDSNQSLGEGGSWANEEILVVIWPPFHATHANFSFHAAM